MVDSIQTAALLGGANSKPLTLSDLVTGTQTNLLQATLSAISDTSSKLTSSQDSSLKNIKDYVANNLSGANADKLNAQIGALEKLFALNNNNDQSIPDPIFSLLSANNDSLKYLPSGSLVNTLL